MLAILQPPEWLRQMLPEGARNFLDSGGWYAVLGVLGLLLLLLLWLVCGSILRGLFAREPPPPPKDDLREDLESIPPPPASRGDRRLTVEGTPVRLRLVVVAPAGTGYTLEEATVNSVLDRVLPGLGEVAERDQPRTRIWPGQLSYEGFANVFHRNTPVPEGEKVPTRWVLVAGRADMGGRYVLVGLALQTLRPTTIGRLTLDRHQWATTLRIKVMES
jgi:hypothetical protein